MLRSINKISLLLLLALSMSSCRETWTAGYKRAFYQACTEEAVKWAGTEDKAKTYCDCVFEKMYKRYPHEEDALAHLDSLAIDPELKGCKAEIEKTLTK